MTIWIIEPRDPLIVRDGRPFGPNPGARAKSLAFPFPSTTTGAVRTSAGLNEQGHFTASPEEMRRLAVRGPLLVELNDQEGEIVHWLAPAPADVLLFQEADERQATIKPLVPLQPFAGAQTNLPDDLALVGLPRPDPAKPHPKAPRFWFWGAFKRWLIGPVERPRVPLKELGHSGPEPEYRMHVSIAADTLTGVEGALFQTNGLEFTHPAPDPQRHLSTPRRLALAVVVKDDAKQPREGLAPFGGERRLATWRQSRQALPACPPEVRQAIVDQGHCRLILLTPGIFAGGYRPAWAGQPADGLTPSLAAIAVQRAQVVSGWDYTLNNGHGGPKPTRKVAPAGTVLFLKLSGSPEAIGAWVDRHWLTCVSDDDQDQCDGFGMAALGTWDGKLHPMEDAR